MQFSIDSASHIPIHLQLARQIRGAVARGRLRPGDKVPSVRDLSRQVVVNPNTVARVYGDLEHEGVLVTRAGLGVYIAPRASQLTVAARTERVTRLLDECFTEGVLLGLSRDDMRQLYETRINDFAWSDTAA